MVNSHGAMSSRKNKLKKTAALRDPRRGDFRFARQESTEINTRLLHGKTLSASEAEAYTIAIPISCTQTNRDASGARRALCLCLPLSRRDSRLRARHLEGAPHVMRETQPSRPEHGRDEEVETKR